MPYLGGSPLNLVAVQSRPTADGMSTFVGGRSRNINVNFYNAGREADKQKLKKSGQKSSKSGAFSVFTGGTLVKPWPGIDKVGKDSGDNTGLVADYPGVSRRTLHNNDIYDTSILNIVEKLSKSTSGALRASDFAYLKHIGVFPNNRLIICRRFSGPCGDDVFRIGTTPLAVLIGFREPGTDFLDITFGEEWTDAEGGFESILNGIGDDILKVSGLGTQAGKAFNAIPLPGWTENLQRLVLEKIGVFEQGASSRKLPAGDPNLIKEAKARKTIPNGTAGSGLSCKVSIKVDIEYEQKFISGIDSTIVYQDIIQNVLRFATSQKTDFGLDPDFGAKMKSWAKNPKLLIDEIFKVFTDAIKTVKDELLKFLNDIISSDGEEEDTEGEEAGFASQLLGVVQGAFDKVTGSLLKVISKYEQQIIGVISALSGLPSTPWHVTIGNPLRPIFCAGDMYTTAVTLTMGSTLMFNDLPANIKVSFQLDNARPWGLQEIMAKFNTGNIRTVNIKKDSNSLLPGQLFDDNTYQFTEQNQGPVTGTTSPTQNAGSTSPQNSSDIKPGSNPEAKLGATGSQTPQSKEGGMKETIDPDPNSKEPPAKKEVKQEVNTPDWKPYTDVEVGFVAWGDARSDVFSGQGSPPTAGWRVKRHPTPNKYFFEATAPDFTYTGLSETGSFTKAIQGIAGGDSQNSGIIADLKQRAINAAKNSFKNYKVEETQNEQG
jgi:hypothetical protein